MTPPPWPVLVAAALALAAVASAVAYQLGRLAAWREANVMLDAADEALRRALKELERREEL